MSKQKPCNDCAFPDGNRFDWCDTHPRFTEAEYKRRLIDRAREVNLDPQTVAVIRGFYYPDQKKSPLDILDLIERKIKSLGEGEKKQKYLRVMKALNGMRYPRFWDIVKPYEDLIP